jgi:hypothetical protein
VYSNERKRNNKKIIESFGLSALTSLRPPPLPALDLIVHPKKFACSSSLPEATRIP